MLTPSRGLVQSRVVEAVMANIADAERVGHIFRGWRLVHSLPIPDCDERAAELGIETGARALWWVEEDTIPPDGALRASIARLRAGAPIVAIDYPVGEQPTWSCIPHFGDDGYGHDIPWCGLGCTLIDRAVFETIARPWFRTDEIYMIRQDNGRVWLDARPDPRPNHLKYGQQDISFFRRASQAGYEIAQLAGWQATQAKLRALGKSGTNEGAHEIELVATIERPQVLR